MSTFCSLNDSVILSPSFRYLRPYMPQAFPSLCDSKPSWKVLRFGVGFFSKLLFRIGGGRLPGSMSCVVTENFVFIFVITVSTPGKHVRSALTGMELSESSLNGKNVLLYHSC